MKVRADNETRSQIVEIVQLFRAKTVDVSPEAVTIEATGGADTLHPRPRLQSDWAAGLELLPRRLGPAGIVHHHQHVVLGHVVSG